MNDRFLQGTEAMHLELSSFCNVDCEPCIYKYMDRQKGFMSMETATEVMLQMTKAPLMTVLPDLKHITFNGFGESLLNPEAIDIIKMFGDVHPWEALNSNATVYNEELTTAGIDELVLNVNQYEGQRFDNAVRYINNMGNLKHLVLQLLISPNTQGMVEKFIENFRPYLSVSDKIQIYLKYPTHSVLYGVPFENLRDDLEKFEEKQIVVGGTNYMIGAETCHGANGLLILDDGTMSMGCCQVGLMFRIGHIKDGIFNVLTGSKGNLYDIKDRREEVEPCKTCVKRTKEYKEKHESLSHKLAAV